MIPFHIPRTNIPPFLCLKNKAKTVDHRRILVPRMLQAFVKFLGVIFAKISLRIFVPATSHS